MSLLLWIFPKAGAQELNNPAQWATTTITAPNARSQSKS